MLAFDTLTRYATTYYIIARDAAYTPLRASTGHIKHYITHTLQSFSQRRR